MDALELMGEITALLAFIDEQTYKGIERLEFQFDVIMIQFDSEMNEQDQKPFKAQFNATFSEDKSTNRTNMFVEL